MKTLVLCLLLPLAASVRLKEGKHLDIFEVDQSEHEQTSDDILNEHVTNPFPELTTHYVANEQDAANEALKPGVKLNEATGGLENIVVEISEELKNQDCKHLIQVLKVIKVCIRFILCYNL